MTALIIGTHGNYSKEIIKSAEMIFGDQDNVGCVTFKPGEGTEDLIRKYEELIHNFDCTDGILFMVDIFGGSPFNAASMLALKNENMEVITGVNLPMLLEVFAYRDSSSLLKLAEIAQNAGKEAIRKLVKQINSDISVEEDGL